MSEVVPVVKGEKQAYTGDGVATMDGWADNILRALRGVAGRFLSEALRNQYRRMALSAVSSTVDEATDNFYASINRAIGVDMRAVAGQGDMMDFMEAMAAQNASLITSIPQEYLLRVENAVVQGTLNGEAPSVITRNIQAAAGVSYRRAKNIARDQSSRITGQVVRKRQKDSGITHFKWVTSNDERTTGKPGGAYPNAKIKCWQISQRDIGFGKGVYKLDEGAKYGGESRLFPGSAHVGCRCTQTPLFSWEVDGD